MRKKPALILAAGFGLLPMALGLGDGAELKRYGGPGRAPDEDDRSVQEQRVHIFSRLLWRRILPDRLAAQARSAMLQATAMSARAAAPPSHCQRS